MATESFPLEQWASIHPGALAVARGELTPPAGGDAAPPRSVALAQRLAEANRGWGNPVDGELGAWLSGATTVVTGQQPGLLGGPLLTLVKACAVAATVSRMKQAGRQAVGFLWLATSDDDLPEMGWARVANGEELLEVREESWQRGLATAAAAPLGHACESLLQRLGEASSSAHAHEAITLATECYVPGANLGAATARFLSALLTGTGVVIVDASEPELARAAAPVLETVLAKLPQAYEALTEGANALRQRGWSAPLRVARDRLPVFRAVAGRRERLASERGACPEAVLREVGLAPDRFLPNVWLRPLVQDAALGAGVSILGGAELAYHLQGAALWELAGLRRAQWRLRPHVTVVSSAERRLARQLRVTPPLLLRASLPRHLVGGGTVRRALARLRDSTSRRIDEVELAASAQYPALKSDVDATRAKLLASVDWLEDRVVQAATRAAQVESGRWARLQAFLRPRGEPQERALSVLAPLLRLGTRWPARLASVLDPEDPGMHLLFWEEGEAW